VLVDDALNTLSLRLYNEDADPTGYTVKVKQAGHTGETETPFFKRIDGLVKPLEAPWLTFSNAVARAVRVRAQNLRARINEEA